MMRRWFPVLGALSLLCAMSVGLGRLSSTRPPSPGAVSPTLEAPQAATPPFSSTGSRSLPETIADAAAAPTAPDQYIGVIFARQLADIVARAEGRVEAVYVHLGDPLKPGDAIAKIESYALTQQRDMAEASLRSTQAEVRRADVELKDAEARYSRRERLVNAGFLSKEELAAAIVHVERARTTLEVAQARVTEQQARVRQTKDALAHTVITAPFAGTVAARYLDPGATVQAASPVVTMMRTDDLWVRFAVPEALQATLPVGSPISLDVEGLPGMIPGMVASTAPGVDSLAREVLIEAQLHVPAAWTGQLKPGLSGYVVATRERRAVGMSPRHLTSASRVR